MAQSLNNFCRVQKCTTPIYFWLSGILPAHRSRTTEFEPDQKFYSGRSSRIKRITSATPVAFSKLLGALALEEIDTY